MARTSLRKSIDSPEPSIMPTEKDSDQNVYHWAAGCVSNITPGRRQSKTSILSRNVDQKSMATFSTEMNMNH